MTATVDLLGAWNTMRRFCRESEPLTPEIWDRLLASAVAGAIKQGREVWVSAVVARDAPPDPAFRVDGLDVPAGLWMVGGEGVLALWGTTTVEVRDGNT